MAKITGNYEAMVVFSTKAGDEAVASLVARFKDMIEANATLTGVDEWGKRKLAYDINYESEGYIPLSPRLISRPSSAVFLTSPTVFCALWLSPSNMGTCAHDAHAHMARSA